MKSALFHALGLRGFSCGSRFLRRAKWNAGASSAILFASPPLFFCREVWNPVLPLRARFYPRSSGLRSHARMADVETYTFGPYKIQHSEVFHTTSLSYAMVNLRPVVPGHVLICPKREVKRFVDLTSDEVCDLWLTAKKVGSHLEDYHKASSLTFTIQDGPQAGQTVPHVHIHILPRKAGDFEKNDEIYDAIDIKEKELKEKLDLDKERKDRTRQEMAQEAAEYRALFS